MAVAITVMVLVLLAMIGSLWWLLPTPAERRRMKLRQLAFSHGLKVREARDEMAEWQIDVTERGVLMEYYLFREEVKGGRWDIVRPGGISIRQKESQQLEASHPAMALVEWEKLPADLLMWCRRDQKYSFFWFEGCDAEGLKGAIDTLKKLSQY